MRDKSISRATYLWTPPTLTMNSLWALGTRLLPSSNTTLTFNRTRPQFLRQRRHSVSNFKFSSNPTNRKKSRLPLHLLVNYLIFEKLSKLNVTIKRGQLQENRENLNTPCLAKSSTKLWRSSLEETSAQKVHHFLNLLGTNNRPLYKRIHS